MEKRSEFDYSMSSTYQTCQRRYNYRYNRGLVGKEPQRPLSFGGAIHKALDGWYTGKDVDECVQLFKDEYEEDLDKDDKRTHKIGEWILRNYFSVYADQGWELVASEQAFEVPLPNGNKWIGRIDKIIRWNGVMWVVDHKTTSALGASYFKGFEPSLQLPGYVWAARKMGYTECKGAIVDALLVAKGLLEASRRAKLTPLARYDVYYSQEQLDEWLAVVHNLQYLMEASYRKNFWTPNFDACTYYGECPYRKVCKEDQGIRERIIQSDYEVSFWDPREEN